MAYTSHPGKFSAQAGECYPDDSESEIVIPEDLEQQLSNFALCTLVPRWMKEIEKQVSDMEIDGMPALWQEYQDDAQNCEREEREER